MSERSVVIVGAGHAGVQAAASLREDGFEATRSRCSAASPTCPISARRCRRPFSRAQMDLAGLPLRGEKFYREQRIDLRLGVAADAHRPRRRRVELAARRRASPTII